MINVDLKDFEGFFEVSQTNTEVNSLEAEFISDLDTLKPNKLLIEKEERKFRREVIRFILYFSILMLGIFFIIGSITGDLTIANYWLKCFGPIDILLLKIMFGGNLFVKF